MSKRIGVYLRVSTLGQSTDLQRREIETFLESRGWRATEFYEDKQTGTTKARPALLKLMRDAREGQIQTVVCWKICRIARSLRDLVSILQEFSELGVSFISLKDQIDMTTSSGRLLTHLLGAFAEFEASLIKERVVAGLAHAKAKGIRLGRRPTIDGDLVARLRESGMSMGEIAKKLGITKSAVSKTLSKRRAQVAEISSALESNSGVEQTSVLETSERPEDGQS